MAGDEEEDPFPDRSALKAPFASGDLPHFARDCAGLRMRLEQILNTFTGEQVVVIRRGNLKAVVEALRTYEHQTHALMGGAAVVDREELPKEVAQVSTEYREAAYKLGVQAMDGEGPWRQPLEEAAEKLARAADLIELLSEQVADQPCEPEGMPEPPEGEKLAAENRATLDEAPADPDAGGVLSNLVAKLTGGS